MQRVQGLEVVVEQRGEKVKGQRETTLSVHLKAKAALYNRVILQPQNSLKNFAFLGLNSRTYYCYRKSDRNGLNGPRQKEA